MESKFKRDAVIEYSQSGVDQTLDVLDIFDIAQDMATDFLGTYEKDNINLKLKYNALWVITKTKMKANRYPNWGEKIFGEIYFVSIKPIRVQIEVVFRDRNGNVLFIIDEEYCVIDMDTRKIRKIDTVEFPKEINVYDNLFERKFLGLRDEVKNYSYTEKVRVCDLDYSHHTNNVSYVRYILNSFDLEKIYNEDIEEFEIHYIKESREKNELEIYKDEIENNSYLFSIKFDGNDITKAYVKFKEKSNISFEYAENKIYALDENNNRVGVIEYEKLENGDYNIYHTEVDESMKGKGIASKLVKEAMSHIDGNVQATCSYAKEWIKRHEKDY